MIFSKFLMSYKSFLFFLLSPQLYLKKMNYVGVYIQIRCWLLVVCYGYTIKAFYSVKNLPNSFISFIQDTWSLQLMVIPLTYHDILVSVISGVRVFGVSCAVLMYQVDCSFGFHSLNKMLSVETYLECQRICVLVSGRLACFPSIQVMQCTHNVGPKCIVRPCYIGSNAIYKGYKKTERESCYLQIVPDCAACFCTNQEFAASRKEASPGYSKDSWG